MTPDQRATIERLIRLLDGHRPELMYGRDRCTICMETWPCVPGEVREELEDLLKEDS